MLQRADLWGGLFWLVISVFVTWQGYQLGLGRLNDPGSGFALFWIGLFMAGFALAISAGSVLRDGAKLVELWAGTRWRRVLTVIAMLIVYGLVFESVGFVPATSVLLLSLMLFVDPVRWPLAIVISIGAPLAIWVVVTRWLKIQMPAGLLSSWIG